MLLIFLLELEENVAAPTDGQKASPSAPHKYARRPATQGKPATAGPNYK